MSSDTGSSSGRPTTTGTTSPPGTKIVRITTSATQLLDEIHAHPLDAASRDRLRAIDTHIVEELLADLTPDLRHELQTLAEPFTGHAEYSDTELRLAHAQLTGWLHGLLQTLHTDGADPHPAASTAAPAPQTSAPSDRTPTDSVGPSTRPIDAAAPRQDRPANRAARRTLITAIIRRITQQRLTAAQAAAALHLTGPQITQLYHANIDAFTLDDLLDLLPALGLTLQVTPEPDPVDETLRAAELPA